MAECLYAMAESNPAAQMGIVDHVKDAVRQVAAACVCARKYAHAC